MDEPAALLTEDEVAARLKCSRKTVQRRSIPHVKMGRLRRYRQEDVEAYICTCVAKQPEEPPSSPSPEEKLAKPIGRRAGKSRFGRRMVQSPQDELNAALALNVRLRATAKRGARSGTSNMRNALETAES